MNWNIFDTSDKAMTKRGLFFAMAACVFSSQFDSSHDQYWMINFLGTQDNPNYVLINKLELFFGSFVSYLIMLAAYFFRYMAYNFENETKNLTERIDSACIAMGATTIEAKNKIFANNSLSKILTNVPNSTLSSQRNKAIVSILSDVAAVFIFSLFVFYKSAAKLFDIYFPELYINNSNSAILIVIIFFLFFSLIFVVLEFSNRSRRHLQKISELSIRAKGIYPDTPGPADLSAFKEEL